MTDFNLGHVVGADGAKGDKGTGIQSITKTSTAGLVDTYTILFTDGTTTTFNVTNGSNASVTIQTSWGSTTSDSKVPSEKLTKDTLDTKIAKSSTTGLVKNDGTIMTSGTGSTNYSAGNHTHSGYVSGSKVTSWSSTVSDSNIPSEKLVKNTIDGLSIPTKTSDLTNDGADGTNVFVANNDSRLSDSRTPTSHTHGNLTNDGKVGSSSNYFVYTTTSGAITSKQKIGNITTSGAIGSTSGKPIITTTSGVLTTGSFGTSSGTFAEGNHTHSNYISTSSTTGLVKNDGSIDTNTYLTSSAISGMLTSSDIANNLTTTASGKVLDARQGKALADLIGDAITYINQ